MKQVIALGLFFSGLVLFSCSNGKKGSATFSPVSQMVTPSQGGTVTASNGVSVSVPRGAVSSNTNITIAPSTTTPPDNIGQAGISVQFGPSGLHFAQPVTITLPYEISRISSNRTPGVWTREDASGSAWEFIGGLPGETGFYQTETSHFSVCVVGTQPLDGCNAITNSGATINETRIAQAMPAMTGGVLVDGTYELTKWELYTGPDGATGTTGNTKRSTFTTAAGVWQVVELKSTDGAESAFTLTCAPSGTSINCTGTCAGSGSFSLPYTITTSAGGTVLQLIDTNSSPTHLETWVKRGAAGTGGAAGTDGGTAGSSAAGTGGGTAGTGGAAGTDGATPTPTDVALFNGTYTGSWSAVDQLNTDNGTLTFTVIDGVMTGVANPGVISDGAVSASGALAGSGLFNGHLNCIGGALTVDFVGQITLDSLGAAVANGDFTDPSGDPPNCIASSGPWTARRVSGAD